jgi:hypothetical protein
MEEMIAGVGGRGSGWVHLQFGANFDSRFSSREAAKNAKEKACDGFSARLLEEISSAMEFSPLRVLCGFA